jgi:hypothetical protein
MYTLSNSKQRYKFIIIAIKVSMATIIFFWGITEDLYASSNMVNSVIVLNKKKLSPPVKGINFVL